MDPCNVLFQKQLGTLKAKSERIAALSEYIASEFGENTTQAHRAGLLSKTDLMTEMVLEFPQVQGTMGKYYAQHDGEDADVAQALEDQYRPRFSGKASPEEYTEPFPYKVMKSDVLSWVAVDEQIQKVEMKLCYYDTVVVCVAEILKQIHQMSYNIKNMIER